MHKPATPHEPNKQRIKQEITRTIIGAVNEWMESILYNFSQFDDEKKNETITKLSSQHGC